jgi:hypothetical protein
VLVTVGVIGLNAVPPTRRDPVHVRSATKQPAL